MESLFTIREKREGDEAAVARLLEESFRDKYFAICGGDAAAALAIITDELKWRGRAGNLFVAESEGRVIGSIELLGCDFGGVSDSKITGIYMKHLGLGKGMRALYLLSLLGRAIAPEDACISHLSVDPESRRRGVARALLSAAEVCAANKGKSRIVLWVSVDNAAAAALYESKKFTVEKKSESANIERFFGCGAWLKYSKDIHA